VPRPKEKAPTILKEKPVRKNRIAIIPVITGLISLCCAIPSAWAGGDHEANEVLKTISVSGEGSVATSPDRAILRLGVESRGENAAEALALNAQAMEAVVNVLKGESIAEADMATSSFSVWEERAYDPETKAPAEHGTYRATNGLRVTVKDLSSVGKLIDLAAKAGANQFQGISFQLKDGEGSKRQARVLAMKDARARAQELAAAEGLKLGEVLSIQEGGSSAAAPQFESAKMRTVALAAAPTQVAPGEMEISVSVSVVYTLTR